MSVSIPNRFQGCELYIFFIYIQYNLNNLKNQELSFFSPVQ